IHDKLCLHRIAADVPLGTREQTARLDQTENVAQVQIAIDDLGDFLATDIAEITAFAAGHKRATGLFSENRNGHGIFSDSTSVTGQGNLRWFKMLTGPDRRS